MNSSWYRFSTVILLLASASPAAAGDWLTWPSTFTHDPTTGSRVRQYAPVEAPPLTDQSSLVTSGFSHNRSSIQVGQSADNYYRVDQWGPPVRPYGEWRFPYRPYSAPYGAWGPPFGGLNLGFGFPPVGVPFPPPGHAGPGPGQFGPGPGQPGMGQWQPGAGHGFPFAPGHQPMPGNPLLPGGPFNPYPSAPGSAYPDPPWFDGFHPDYPVNPRLNDEDFFRRPNTGW